MNALIGSIGTVTAGGLMFALAETLLPRSGVRNTARIAIGFLFLALLTEQILGIIP